MADVAHMVEIVRYRTQSELWKVWAVVQTLNKQGPSLGIEMVRDGDFQVFVAKHGISIQDARSLERIILETINLFGENP